MNIYRVYREIGLFGLMWVLSWGREIGLFFRVYPELGLFRKALCLCMNLQKRVACGSAFSGFAQGLGVAK